MSYQVFEEHKGLQEGLPTVASLEGLLCSVNSLPLLAIGDGWEGLLVPSAPA